LCKNQIIHQSSQFNRGIAVSTSEQILLNAARASKDLPLLFTHVTQYTSNNMLNGKFSPDFPFGGDAMSIFNFKPEIDWSPGVSNAQWGDLNNAEGLKPLNAPLTPVDIQYYY
jgi:hypothetical protein